MTNPKHLRATMRKVQRQARRAIDAAQPTAQHVTITGRTNVVSAIHTDEPGATTTASAQQDAPITQEGTPETEETAR